MATPSYPQRVVRHLTERKHKVTSGVTDELKYQDELHRVLGRVTSDTSRGLASKIITLNAIRDAELCDASVAAKYKNACLGANSHGVESSDEQMMTSGTGDTAGAPSEQSVGEKYSFDNLRWHTQPGADPWAFSLDEDTNVLRELEFLTKKSQEMNRKAREMAESVAKDIMGMFAMEELKKEFDGKAKPDRVVEIGTTDTESTLHEIKSDETCENRKKEAQRNRDKETALYRSVLASTSTSLRRAESAVRDVENFAHAIQRKYPYPEVNKNVGNVESDEISSHVASWDDVDPTDPEGTVTPVHVHWTDIGVVRDTKISDDKENSVDETNDEEDTTVGDTEENERETEPKNPIEESPPVVSESPDKSPESTTHPPGDVPEPEPDLNVVDAFSASLVKQLVRGAITNVLETALSVEESLEPPLVVSEEEIVASLVRVAIENVLTYEQTVSETPSRPPQKRALLVGCNYFNPACSELTRLRGSLNDVASVHKMLRQSNLGFETENVKILIDTPTDGNTSFLSRSFGSSGTGTSDFGWLDGTRVPAVLSELISSELIDPAKPPTTKTIKAELQKLIKDAVPNDFLLFHFSGHASQVPDESLSELDGAFESLCTVDMDWQNNLGITEVDLSDLFKKVEEIGCTLLVTVDAKHCGALNGSVTYVADDNFVDTARKQIGGTNSVKKKSELHDSLFGRFVAPPTFAAKRIATLSNDAKEKSKSSFGSTQNLVTGHLKAISESKSDVPVSGPSQRGTVVLTGCHASRGETCRESKSCVDGAIRGAFTNGLCEVLTEMIAKHETEPESEKKASSPVAIATAVSDAMRLSLTKEYAVDQQGARKQTPLAVVGKGTETVKLFE